MTKSYSVSLHVHDTPCLLENISLKCWMMFKASSLMIVLLFWNRVGREALAGVLVSEAVLS